MDFQPGGHDPLPHPVAVGQGGGGGVAQTGFIIPFCPTLSAHTRSCEVGASRYACFIPGETEARGRAAGFVAQLGIECRSCGW